MSEEQRYVDPNSGGAPQPGSFAGEQAVAKGFGPPPVAADGSGVLGEEPVPSAYEAPGAPSNPTPTPSEAFGLETAASAPADEDEDEDDEDAQVAAVAEDEPASEAVPEGEAPGDGVEKEGVEAPADGTWSEPIEGDGEGVLAEPETPAEEGAAEADYQQGNARAVEGSDRAGLPLDEDGNGTLDVLEGQPEAEVQVEAGPVAD